MCESVKPQPFIKWAGGKRQLLPAITERLPVSFDHYFEPFVGGGALFWELRQEQATINDINKTLISAYRYLQTAPRDFIEVLEAIDSNQPTEPTEAKEYYYLMRDEFNNHIASDNHSMQTAALFVYLNKHCFNGLFRVNSKGLFNVPFNGSKTKSFNAENLLAVSNALKSAKILNGDFENACKDAKRGDFIFFDSPYAPLNPTSFEAYTKEGFAIEEHKRLAGLFKKLDSRGCYCMLTNHNTELIRELYGDYFIETFEVKRSINSDSSKRYGTEVIIRNYQ